MTIEIDPPVTAMLAVPRGGLYMKKICDQALLLVATCIATPLYVAVAPAPVAAVRVHVTTSRRLLPAVTVNESVAPSCETNEIAAPVAGVARSSAAEIAREPRAKSARDMFDSYVNDSIVIEPQSMDPDPESNWK